MKIIAVYGQDRVQADAMKIMVWPDSVMIRSGKPLFLPEYGEYGVKGGIGVKINAVGKSIRPKFAGRYYSEITPMAFILPQNVIDCLEEGGDPLACDIVADYSIICGDYIQPFAESFLIEIREEGIRHYQHNVEIRDLSNLIASAIATASRQNTLKTGDIVGIVLPGSLKAEYDSILKMTFGQEFSLLVNKLK